MVGHKLKSLRESKGYSQEYLAAQCNIDQCSYSRIESGKIKPDISKLKIFASILQVDFYELVELLALSQSEKH
jgi:transcriptional regulator with XRE-family HTH domain